MACTLIINYIIALNKKIIVIIYHDISKLKKKLINNIIYNSTYCRNNYQYRNLKNKTRKRRKLILIIKKSNLFIIRLYTFMFC